MKLTSRQIFRERRGIAVQYLKDKIDARIFGTRCKTIIFRSNRSECLGQRPYFFSLVYFPDSVTHTLQLEVRLFSLVLGQHKCCHIEALFLVVCRSALGLFRSCVRQSGLEGTQRSAQSRLASWCVLLFQLFHISICVFSPVLASACQFVTPAWH